VTSPPGKTVVISGATGGIGLVTARELARKGYTVVGIGRDAGKCETAAEQIRTATGNPEVHYLVADLSVQSEIRAVADTFRERFDRLDVLVNNAGGYFRKRQVSRDGIELTWALNHLGYFLLTHQLLDLLKGSAPARVVSVSSEAHRRARINFEDLEGRRRYRGFEAYGQSKLANVLFTYELARRLDGTSVTANAVHPGFVATRFGHSDTEGFTDRLFDAGMTLVQRLMALSPEEGAQTSIYVASSPEVENVTGLYFSKQRAERSSPASYDEAVAKRLWELSERMVGL
jgi:retinol dehydrogenase 12